MIFDPCRWSLLVRVLEPLNQRTSTMYVRQALLPQSYPFDHRVRSGAKPEVEQMV